MDSVETSAPVEQMLQRLDKVRKNGKRGWVARCPCHDDKSASLSVGEGSGGRVLLNCFAGCTPLEVVQSLGMTLAELFPQQIDDNMSREEQMELHAIAMRTKWTAALDELDRESLVVRMVAERMQKGMKPGEGTLKRLLQATERIERARVTLKTGPAKKRLGFDSLRAIKTGARK